MGLVLLDKHCHKIQSAIYIFHKNSNALVQNIDMLSGSIIWQYSTTVLISINYIDMYHTSLKKLHQKSGSLCEVIIQGVDYIMSLYGLMLLSMPQQVHGIDYSVIVHIMIK